MHVAGADCIRLMTYRAFNEGSVKNKVMYMCDTACVCVCVCVCVYVNCVCTCVLQCAEVCAAYSCQPRGALVPPCSATPSPVACVLQVLSVTEMFAKQLLQVPGITSEKAAAIVERYSTPTV